MSKSITKANSSAQLVAGTVGEFWAFWNFDDNCPLYNPGRDDAESWGVPEKELPNTMARGFDMAKGVGRVFDVEQVKAFAEVMAKRDGKQADLWAAIAADPVAVAKEQRERRAKEWQESDDKIVYTIADDAKDDLHAKKTVELAYSVVGGFLLGLKADPVNFVFSAQRRTYALPFTAVLSERREYIDDAANFEFFASPMTFTTVADLHSLLADENDATGKRPYSPIGLLSNAIEFMCEQPSMKELELGEKLGLTDDVVNNRGNRQKYHKWARVACMFDDGENNELDLYRRIRLSPDDFKVKSGKRKGKLKYDANGIVPVKPLKWQVAQAILGEVREKTDLDDATKGIVDSDYRGEWDATQVEKYFKRIVLDEKVAKITTGNLKEWKKNKRIANRTTTIGEVLTAILENDADFFDKGPQADTDSDS